MTITINSPSFLLPVSPSWTCWKLPFHLYWRDPGSQWGRYLSSLRIWVDGLEAAGREEEIEFDCVVLEGTNLCPNFYVFVPKARLLLLLLRFSHFGILFQAIYTLSSLYTWWRKIPLVLQAFGASHSIENRAGLERMRLWCCHSWNSDLHSKSSSQRSPYQICPQSLSDLDGPCQFGPKCFKWLLNYTWKSSFDSWL